ncbi:MAG: glycosyltransferase family 2 protein [Balneolaceae bacterium]|nr:MAG: glycosyltransferase family 2 protein [Balneolaceae bacterium]
MQSQIRITIAICTFNRASYLKDTLDDLGMQTADPAHFELLVVNNNSKDGTETVCEIFKKTHPEINFKSVKEQNQGLSYARNRAAKEAGSSVLIYIDDDVNLPENYVQTAIDYVEKRPSTLCAGGRIFVSFDDEENTDWIPKELMPMFGLHDLGDDNRIYPPTNFPRGGNMMIRKTVFDAFGYFDTTLGRTGKELLGSEEKAFFERIRKNGVELHYWADMELTHRIGYRRLEKEYLEKQSVGIGKSERLRLDGQPVELAKKFGIELIKLVWSLVLSAGYYLSGNSKAARFILQFRIWVLQGFLSGYKSD